MATVTLTASTAAASQYWYKPNSSYNRQQSYVTTASLSTQDVIMFKGIPLPHGMVVTDIRFRGSVVDGTQILEIGTIGSNATIDVFGSITISATAVTNSVLSTGLPYTVSVSDDAAVRYQWMAVRADGAATSQTTSMSFNLTVKGYTR